MRKVKHLSRRMDAVSGWRIDNPIELRGVWISGLMPKAGSLCVELGCGKGAFLCEAARRRPDCLFIGFEKIPDAAIKGMERAADEGLHNIRFVVEDVAALTERFSAGEADELYLNFSDPWPHWKHASRRLTHQKFLAMYAEMLKPGGILIFKTDNIPLFRFSVKELESSGWRITKMTEDLPAGDGNIETEYEQKFRSMGVNICRLEAVRSETG